MKPIRIVIFAERLGTAAGGTEVYEASLIAELFRICEENRKDVEIVPLLSYKAGLKPLPEHVRHICRVTTPQGKAGTLLTSGLIANHLAPSLLHAMFIRPPLIKRNIPLITTVHDLGFQEFPAHYPRQLVRKLNWNLKRTVEYPGIIVTVSEFTRRTLIDRTGITPDRVITVLNGIDHSLFYKRDMPEPGILQKYGIRKPFILYAGRLQPRKNIRNLVETYNILRRRRLFNGQFVMLGSNRAFLCEAEQKYVDDSPFRKDIIQPGHIPFEEVPLFLNHAHAFLFLSLYEGFGFPVIEAMACGTPVICSNTTSLPEVAGNAALLVNPKAPEQAAEAVHSLENIETRRNLINKGMVQAGKFIWKKSAETMLDIYVRYAAPQRLK